MSTLTSALWITLIGMGLVFIALLLLWGLMLLIVSATAKQAAAEVADAGEEEQVEEAGPAAAEQPEVAILRQKAAAAAVAVALGMQKKGKAEVAARHPVLASESGPSSAWQAVLRANQLTQKSRMYSRKQRGNG